MVSAGDADLTTAAARRPVCRRFGTCWPSWPSWPARPSRSFWSPAGSGGRVGVRFISSRSPRPPPWRTPGRAWPPSSGATATSAPQWGQWTWSANSSWPSAFWPFSPRPRSAAPASLPRDRPGRNQSWRRHATDGIHTFRHGIRTTALTLTRAGSHLRSTITSIGRTSASRVAPCRFWSCCGLRSSGDGPSSWSRSAAVEHTDVRARHSPASRSSAASQSRFRLGAEGAARLVAALMAFP